MKRNLWNAVFALRLAAVSAAAMTGSMFANSCTIDLPFFDSISIDVDNDDDDDWEDFFDDLFDDD